MRSVNREKRWLITAFSLLFFSSPALAQQTSTDTGWISPLDWPWQYSAEAATDTLLLLETNGVVLDLRLDDGTVVDAPGPEHIGPEFLFIPAGASLGFSLNPRYLNHPGGSLRVRQLSLDDPALSDPAYQLHLAGIEAVAQSTETVAAACQRYRLVAENENVPAAWRYAARVFEPRCQFRAGTAIAREAGLNPTESTAVGISVLPYHYDMMSGKVAFAREEHDRAVIALQQALASAESMRGMTGFERAVSLDIASMNIELGMNLMMQVWRSGNAGEGAMDNAESVMRAGLQQASEQGDHMLMSEGYDYLAAHNFVSGNPQEMIDNLLLALQELQTSGRDDEQIIILGSVGDYYRSQVELRLALQTYLQAMVLLQDAENPAMDADTYQNLASLYRQFGDLPRAQSLAETSKQLWQRLGVSSRAVMVNRELAEILMQQGEYAAAKPLLEEQLAYHDQLEEPWEPLRLHTQARLSETELALGNLQSAYELSEAVMDKVNGRSLAGLFQGVTIMVNHALILQQQGETETAMALINEALAMPGTTAEFMIPLLSAEQKIVEAAGSTEAVINAAERAFSFIESQRMELESARLGPYFSGKMQALYLSHIEYLLGRGESDEYLVARAFEVQERARASSLRLRRQEMRLAQTEDLPEARESWRALLEEMNKGFRGASTEEELVTFERHLGEARELYFSNLGFSAQNPVTLTLAEASSRLPDDVLVMNFVVGQQTAWRFDISNRGWQVHALGSASALAANIDTLLPAIAVPGNDNRQQLAGLSAVLLAGFAPAPGVSRLLISPPSTLDALPFPALLADGAYLGDRYALVMVPSLSEYLTSTGPDKADYSLELAVLADPQFGAID